MKDSDIGDGILLRRDDDVHESERVFAVRELASFHKGSPPSDVLVV